MDIGAVSSNSMVVKMRRCHYHQSVSGYREASTFMVIKRGRCCQPSVFKFCHTFTQPQRNSRGRSCRHQLDSSTTLADNGAMRTRIAGKLVVCIYVVMIVDRVCFLVCRQCGGSFSECCRAWGTTCLKWG